MKTKLIYLILVLSTCAASGQKMDLEFLIGPNLVSLRANDLIQDQLKTKISGSTGLGLNYYLNTKFSIGLKFLYEGKGSSGEVLVRYYDEEGKSHVQDMKVRTTFDYLSLPVTARYSFGKKIKFSGEVGAFISYLLEETWWWDGFGPIPEATGNGTEWYRKTDTGVSIGFSALIPMTEKFSLRTSLLENFGLINISDVPLVGNGTIKTNALNIFLGINYQLN